MIRIAPTVHLSAFELISEQCDMMDKSRAEPGPMNRWVNTYFAETPDHQELLKVLFHMAFILLSYCFHIAKYCHIISYHIISLVECLELSASRARWLAARHC